MNFEKYHTRLLSGRFKDAIFEDDDLRLGDGRREVTIERPC
jgi:hypothetical protein